MTIKELNAEVRRVIPDIDWMTWQGARYAQGSEYATDKIVFVSKKYADPDLFEWMETLEGTKKHKRESTEQAETDWKNLIQNYAVNQLTPLYLFDLKDRPDFSFSFLILLRNETRNQNIIIDGHRYRMLIDSVPVEHLRGTGPSAPIVASISEENAISGADNEVPTGVIAPVTDDGGKYTRYFHEVAPELGLE